MRHFKLIEADAQHVRQLVDQNLASGADGASIAIAAAQQLGLGEGAAVIEGGKRQRDKGNVAKDVDYRVEPIARLQVNAQPVLHGNAQVRVEIKEYLHWQDDAEAAPQLVDALCVNPVILAETLRGPQPVGRRFCFWLCIGHTRKHMATSQGSEKYTIARHQEVLESEASRPARWMPHSVLVFPSQRPLRASSPGCTGFVQGKQPIDR